MRLESAHIKNYRSIADLEIRFDPRCRILVGINESGKSNILGALASLDPNWEAGAEDIREFRANERFDQEAFVEFTFLLDETDRRELKDQFLGLCPGASSGRKLLHRKAGDCTVGKFFDLPIRGHYRVDLRTNDREYLADDLEEDAELLGNWLKPTADWPANGTVVLADDTPLARHDVGLIHESTEKQFPEGYTEQATTLDLEEIVIGLVTDAIERGMPACLYWKYDVKYLLPSHLDLATFAAKPDMCLPLKHMFQLAGVTDIAKQVAEAAERSQGMHNLLSRVSDAATKHIRSVWADYKDLTIEFVPNGTAIDAHVRDKHNRYGFDRRSDGFKRFVSFLLMVSTQERLDQLVNTLYLQDEPDIGLHPSGTRHLRDELIRIADRNYVVVSTHSIFMVDQELVRRHLIVQKKDEETQATEAGKSEVVDEEVIYNALSFSVFQTLKPVNLVFEGWRDKRLFVVASKQLGINDKKWRTFATEIGIAHAKGVSEIGRVTALLELAKRRWIVVSDADNAAKEQQRTYRGDGPWWRYDEIHLNCAALTGEDFLTDERFEGGLAELRSRDPRLSALPTTLSKAPGRMEATRRWIEKAGILAKDTKELLEALKETCFQDLKASHISQEYFEFAEALRKRVIEI